MYSEFDPNHVYQEPSQSSNESASKKPSKHRRFLKATLCLLLVAAIASASIGVYSLVTGGSSAPAPASQSAMPSLKVEESQTPSQSITLGQQNSTGAAQNTTEVASTLVPSVVCIQNYVSNPQNGMNGFQNSGKTNTENTIALYAEGSGIILSKDGYIATNAHVVNGAELLKVITSDGETYEATLVGMDTDTDLAVIHIQASNLTPATLGNSDSLKTGEYVMAIGNPGGSKFASSVTLGIVSALDRPLQLASGGYTMETIQTDAAINPGNSGGALVNMEGQVIGICSAKYVNTSYEGLGFAITINEALPILQDLMNYGSVQNRCMLGITGMFLDETTANYYQLKSGYYVASVSNPLAGDLQKGDVITSVDGKNVVEEATIKDLLKNHAPGDSISVEYYRASSNETRKTEVTLAKLQQNS